jgi:hypothetical protein
LAIVTERRRTQHSVVSTEGRPRPVQQVGGERVWQAAVYLTSEGGGPASTFSLESRTTGCVTASASSQTTYRRATSNVY